MKITIYHPDEVKPIEPFYLLAAEDYTRRLKRYSQIQVVRGKEPPPVSKMKKKLPYQINIHPDGDPLSSTEFASLLETAALSGYSDIAFFLSANTTQADRTICLSPLSMSPSMETVVLLEQIYRAFLINQNVPYHK